MSTEDLDKCSIVSHCFVSSRHTGAAGCIQHVSQIAKQRLPVRRCEIGRPVFLFGRWYIWVDGSAGLCLVRMPGWWV